MYRLVKGRASAFDNSWVLSVPNANFFGVSIIFQVIDEVFLIVSRSRIEI